MRHSLSQPAFGYNQANALFIPPDQQAAEAFDMPCPPNYGFRRLPVSEVSGL